MILAGWLVRRVRPVRRRLTDVPFAAVVGLLGVNGAAMFYLRPNFSPVHALLSPLDYVWSGLYGLGGFLILAGIATARANVEAAGCVAFGGGAAVSAIATAAVVGWPAWNTVTVLGLFAVAAGFRTWHLATGRVLVLLDSPTVTDQRAGE